MVLFLDFGEGHDRKALAFGPEKHRKSWKTAMMRPRSSQPLRKAKKLQKKPKGRGPRTRLKRDLCRNLTSPNRSIWTVYSNTFYVLFSVVFGLLPHKHGEARIRHLDVKTSGTSRIWRLELNILRIVEDLAPGPKNLENC